MGLDIIGFNATFDAFVKFAEAQHTGFDRISVPAKLTIDLSGEEPKVIDAAIAQKLG